MKSSTRTCPRNQRGNGLISVIMTGVILSIVGLALQKMSMVNLKAARTVTAVNKRNEMAAALDMLLSHETKCHTFLFSGGAIPKRAKYLPYSLQRTQPGGDFSENERIKRIGTNAHFIIDAQGGNALLEVTRLSTEAISIDLGDPDQYVYLVLVQIETKPKRTFALANDPYTVYLRMTTNRNAARPIPMHEIMSCSKTDGNVATSPSHRILFGPVTFSPIFVTEGCDRAVLPGKPAGKQECYCGGLETIHRATTNNPTGSPYGHGAYAPAFQHRPRFWAGGLTCPSGYVAVSASANCAAISGTGKMENVIRIDARTMAVNCCVYTPDNLLLEAIRPTFANGMSVFCQKE